VWPFSKKTLYKRATITDFTGRFDVLEIKVPKSDDSKNSKGIDLRTAPIAAEHMFATLHGLLREDSSRQEHFALEFVATDGSIKFYAASPDSISKSLESQIYGQYPSAHITKVSDYVPAEFKHGYFKTATMHLTKPNFFPLKSFKDFEIDPLSSITSALSEVGVGEHVWVQLIIKPIPDVWQKEGYKYIEVVRSGASLSQPSFGSSLGSIVSKEMQELTRTFFDSLAGRYDVSTAYGAKPKGPDIVKLTFSQEQEIKSIENKLSKMGFIILLRFVTQSEIEDRADSLLRSAIASMQQFSTSNLNSFSSRIKGSDNSMLKDYKERVFDEEKGFILNIEELGSIYHLPTALVETPGVAWVGSKKSEPPSNLPTTDCNFIGYTLFRDRKVKFGISNKGDDRLRHMYLIGKSGTGKSTFFKNMIIQDMANGAGIGVLDPHGDLIEDILEYIPDHRVDDVVLVDPSDTERPVGINILELSDPSQKNIMASALIAAVKSQFGYSWGPRLEYLLNYCVLTLLEVPGTSIMGITRLMADQNYQKYILHFVKDPVVIDFWEKEFKAMKGNQRLITEAVAPIENKINRFLSSTTIRNIMGQKKSTIDIWDIMNNGKILLLNLSKGKIGMDNANLLGALLVSRIQFMAMQRVKILSHERRPFYLYVDEFQNFAGGEFESILSESRKYKLGLYLTHQFTNQLPEELLSAVFGNVGTIASFSVGAQDAKILETEFAPYFDQNDLISLQKFQIYMKLMIDGETSKPFSAEIFRPWIPEESIVEKTNNKQLAIERSRARYGTDKAHVEEKIRKWVEFQFDKGKAVAKEYNSKDPSRSEGTVYSGDTSASNAGSFAGGLGNSADDDYDPNYEGR